MEHTNNNTTPGPLWVWLDLETTGLDPATGLILEVGYIVTTPDLEPFEGWEDDFYVGLPTPETDPWALMDAYTLAMHLRSGIIGPRCDPNRCEILHDEAADHLCGEVFGELVARGHTLHLAGFSPHFDLRWMHHHWPIVPRLFSHRLIDVSAWREVLRIHRPELVAKASQGKRAHRALEDCKQAIGEMRHYLDLLGLLSAPAPSWATQATVCELRTDGNDCTNAATWRALHVDMGDVLVCEDCLNHGIVGGTLKDPMQMKGEGADAGRAVR